MQSDPAYRVRLPSCISGRVVSALILREVATTYGRSPGGFLWVLAEPALGLAFLVTLFSLGLREPPLGRDFALFFASGLLPYMMCMTVANRVAQAINQSRALLMYPRVTFLDVVLGRMTLAVTGEATVSCVILGLILGLGAARARPDAATLLGAYGLAVAFGTGVGLANAVLISRHQVWQAVWSTATRPLLLLSGVIVLHEVLPRPYAQWLEWNPLLHITGASRAAFYPGYDAGYVAPLYVLGLALALAVVGLLLLRRYCRDFLER